MGPNSGAFSSIEKTNATIVSMPTTNKIVSVDDNHFFRFTPLRVFFVKHTHSNTQNARSEMDASARFTES